MSSSAPNWKSLGLDLITLHILMAAVEESSLARVAVRENIALSAVSRRISELEGRAGVVLLERHDRGVTATAAGTELYNQLSTIFRLLDRLVENLQDIRGGLRGLVRLHTHMSASAGTLPVLLANFLREYPGIDIEVDEHTSLEVLHAIRTGTADVGLLSSSSAANDLHLIHWKWDHLQVILPTGHGLLKNASVTFAELVAEPFIGMQSDSALLSLCRSQATILGQRLKERCHATSFDSVRRMVSAGLGVSILPAVAAQPSWGQTFEVRPLSESWAERSLALCTRDPDQLSAATKLFISHMLSHESANAALLNR
jgi:DNA-binding transcriptional LysR family regulator